MSAYDKEAALIDRAKREGVEESKKEIIMNMLNNNYDLEEISKIIGLDIEKIKEIVGQ